jgi:F5/8 type C domain
VRSALLLLAFACLHAAAAPRVLDYFANPGLWQVQHSDDVRAAASGTEGGALRLDFDFTDGHGKPINGYATVHRALPLDLPDNFEFSFRVRGDAPVNNLQFKLVDASGDNVWWLNYPDFAFSRDWQEVRVSKREIKFAWGPAQDHTLRHIAAVEFVVSSGRDGGAGSVYFDRLALRELPPEDDSPLKPVRVSASSALPGAPARAAVDGDLQTAWRSDPARGAEQSFVIDLGKPREFSGMVLHWQPGERATRYDIRQSTDGKSWYACHGPSARSADTDFLDLCEFAPRYLRLELHAAEGNDYGLAEIEIKDSDWAATANAFFINVAKASPRGTYPRGFTEQPYWTLVGVDGGGAPALISEDGAIEPRKGRYSIEPSVIIGGRTSTWADVTSTQTLADGYLPMPNVTWRGEGFELSMDTFARGTREAAQIVVRYRLRNLADVPVDATLQLAIRPFQVNPPAQFLNSSGGVGRVRAVHGTNDHVTVDDDDVLLSPAPDHFESRAPDGSLSAPIPLGLHASRLASGLLVYRLQLPAHGEQEVSVVAPIAGPMPKLGELNPAWVEHERDAVAAAWREKLNRGMLSVPPEGQRIADAVRTAHAHILISRDAAALQPGTRSYARSWIRDGAMMADALLRLGDVDAVRDYVDWYVPHQFANGKVPCCVDHRGSDPVPENDSHGELIHAIAQLYRYDGDRTGLEVRWPHVASAIAYMDQLRAGETGAANPAFRGMMPASISHEGYSAKPMHSYWDDFWALTGYKDAAFIAQTLGKPEAAQMAQSRDAFRTDLQASVGLAMGAQGIEFVPGCAELGDFDATSSTVILYPAGEQAQFSEPLHQTFERYWNDFESRASGARPWKDYTPYEWRAVGTFVRLGWRDRAQAAVDFLFRSGARPPGWNQWAEVVGRDPREIRFIGDMPHGWVASDFIRSALDLFAYERDADHALILAPGVPANWFDGAGIAISGLNTPYGRVDYTANRTGNRLVLHVGAGAKPPGGFAFPWPLTGNPGATRINGRRAQWTDGELHMPVGPADVSIEVNAEEKGGAHAH